MTRNELIAALHECAEMRCGSDNEAAGFMYLAAAMLEADGREIAALKDAGEMLWVVVANASEGNWDKQTQEWQDAAARWRDNFFATCKDGRLIVDPAGMALDAKTNEDLRRRAEKAEAERDALRQDAECWHKFKRECEKARMALGNVVGDEIAALDAAMKEEE